MAAKIQGGVIFSNVHLSDTGRLLAKAMNWACEVLNRTACTANADNKSPHEMRHVPRTPAAPLPFPSRHTADGSGRQSCCRRRKVLLPRTTDPPPARLRACADPGGARGKDERCHAGSHAIKEPYATADSLEGAYGGGRENKRRRQFADTATAVGERYFSRVAYVERSSRRR